MKNYLNKLFLFLLTGSVLASGTLHAQDEKKEKRTFDFSSSYIHSPSSGNPYFEVYFSEEPSVASLRGKIEFSPEVKISSIRSYGYRAIRVDGDFKHGCTYEMLIRRGVQSRDRELSLQTDIVRSFDVPDRSSAVEIATEGKYLSPDGAINIPIASMNITGITISVSQVLPQNMVQFVARETDSYNSYFSGRPSSDISEDFKPRQLRVDGEKNKAAESNFSLRSLIGKRRGVFYVSLTGISKSAYDPSDRHLICVTDIGLAAVVDSTTVSVWTTHLSTGKPAEGVAVEIYSLNNKMIGRGISDADGKVRIPFVPGNSPFLVLAREEAIEDLSYLPLISTFDKTKSSFKDVSGNFLKAGEREAFLFLDREIYRPGDKIYVQALVRDKEAKAPVPSPLVLELESSHGASFLFEQFMPDETGSFVLPGGVQLPDQVLSGACYARVCLPGEDGKVIGEKTFYIESFMPRQIKVEIDDLPREIVFPYGEFADTVKVRADYLFGQPAAALSAEAEIIFTPATFSPEGWKGWQFDNPERSFTQKREQLGEVKTEDDGCAFFPLPDLKELGILPASALKGTIQVTVLETGGRPVSARAETLLHFYPFYIGLKAESFESKPGAKNILNAVLVRPDGVMIQEETPALVTLSSVSYYYGYQKMPDGTYRWIDDRQVQKISSHPITLKGATRIPFEVTNDGSYLLSVLVEEQNVENTYAFTVSGDHDLVNSSKRSKPSDLELSLDKDSYQAGETAKLLVKSPFPGTAELTLYRDSLISQRVIRMEGTATTISLPVQKEWYPNFYASVRVINVETNSLGWEARRASDTINIPVKRPADKLEVTVKPAVEIIPGGSRVTADIAVQSFSANAKPRVTVAVVDEAICLLTDAVCPDPYGYFGRSRNSGISEYDLFSQIMLVTSAPQAAAEIGGDGPGNVLKRGSPVKTRRYKPLALFQAELPVVNGLAKLDVKLPEFAGEVRVTAFAWTESATGAADAHAKVKPKLVCQPDAPRFLAGGDQADLTIAIHNTSEADSPVSYRVTYGGLMENLPSSQEEITLKKKESRVIRLPISAPQSGYGEGEIHVEATGCGETHRHTLYMPVRPPVPMTTVYDFSKLKGGESKEFLLPNGIVTNAVRQRILCHSSSYSEFLPALQYLLNYPYGCLEQTVSSVFPLLAADGILAGLGSTNEAQVAEAHHKVSEAIERVCQMRKDDVYYRSWIGSPYTSQENTVYAGYFIAMASQGDWNIDSYSVRENLEILTKVSENAKADVNLRAYACHALAVGRTYRKQLMLHLLDYQNKMTMAGRYHLAIAFALSGRRDLAFALIRQLGAPDSIEAAAFGILAWLELDVPEREEKIQTLYHGLIAYRGSDGHWGNTQRNGLALLAIASLARREKAENPGPFSLRIVKADGKTLCEGISKRASVSADNTAFTAYNDGTGPVTLVRTTEAFPLLNAMEEVENGIRVKRTYYKADLTEVKDGKVKLGDRLFVRLDVTLPKDSTLSTDVIIDELLPSCLEYERAPTDLVFPAFDYLLESDSLVSVFTRDDGICIVPNLGKTKTICYGVRVISSGNFVVPPVCAESMYNSQIRYRSLPSTLHVSE